MTHSEYLTVGLPIAEQGLELVRFIEEDALRPEGFSRVAWFYNQSFPYIYRTDQAISRYLNEDRLDRLTELTEKPVYVEQDARLGILCLKRSVDYFILRDELKKAVKGLCFSEDDEAFELVRVQLERIRDERYVDNFQEDARRDRLGSRELNIEMSTLNLFELLSGLMAILTALKDRNFKLVGASTAVLHNRFAVCSPEDFYREFLKPLRAT